MKKCLFVLSAALSVLALSCNKDEYENFADDWLSVDASDAPKELKKQSALLTGRIEAGKDYKDWEFGFSVRGSIQGSAEYDYSSFRDFPVNSIGDVSLQLDGLATGGHYAYYVYARKDGDEQKSQTVEFYTYTNDGYEMEAVDLGLSVKWAVKNLGADSASEAGLYFAWGETSPKIFFTSDYYAYDGNPLILPRSADAASVQLGGDWRMPLKSEFEELVKKCDWEYTSLDGKLYGIAFSGRGSYKDRWIFFPLGGKYRDYELQGYNSAGYYLSSESRDWSYSYGFHVSYPLMEDISPYIGVSSNCFQSHGYTIRAVKSK